VSTRVIAEPPHVAETAAFPFDPAKTTIALLLLLPTVILRVHVEAEFTVPLVFASNVTPPSD
jgi:hypothetical protein